MVLDEMTKRGIENDIPGFFKGAIQDYVNEPSLCGNTPFEQRLVLMKEHIEHAARYGSTHNPGTVVKYIKYFREEPYAKDVLLKIAEKDASMLLGDTFTSYIAAQPYAGEVYGAIERTIERQKRAPRALDQPSAGTLQRLQEAKNSLPAGTDIIYPTASSSTAAPAEAAVPSASSVESYYFGRESTDKPGHCLFNNQMQEVKIAQSSLPWKQNPDRSFCAEKGQDGTVEPPKELYLHQQGGWTALAFWDRSADARGGSNSVFFAKGTHSVQEMWDIARHQYPAIYKRLDTYLPIAERDVLRIAGLPGAQPMGTQHSAPVEAVSAVQPAAVSTAAPMAEATTSFQPYAETVYETARRHGDLTVPDMNDFGNAPLTVTATRQAASAGALDALYASTQERKVETKEAVEAALNSVEGKKIVSDVVYESVLKALNERSRQN